MIVYALAAVFLSWLGSKIHPRPPVISGKPSILLNHGKLYKENFRKSKIDLNEFTAQCRINGYFDISQLEAAILEENGHISFLPKSENRPPFSKGYGHRSGTDALVANVIIDGHLMTENLKASRERRKMAEKPASRPRDLRISVRYFSPPAI